MSEHVGFGGSVANTDVIRRNAERASNLLKTMGNPHRLMILCLLCGGERSVGELEKELKLSQSALSQHLARLRNQALVETRRQAQMVYYSLASPEAAAIMETLEKVLFTTDKHGTTSRLPPS